MESSRKIEGIHMLTCIHMERQLLVLIGADAQKRQM